MTDPVFTGERFIPGQSGPVLALEHYHRYLLAAHFVKGKRVLDVACGEGYGAAFLAGSARSVLGIDIDEQTIAHARQAYRDRDNLEFQIGRCESLPATLGPFDVVVSFETLEHLSEAHQMEFLRNVSGVLASDGMVILSTPEPDEYAKSRSEPNPFHLRELRRGELEKLLKGLFPHVHILMQKPVPVSFISDGALGTENSATLHVRQSLKAVSASSDELLKPKFLLAVCSNSQPSALTGPVQSFYYDPGEVEQMEKVLHWASGLQKAFDERTRWAFELDALVNEKNAYIGKLQNEFEERTTWALSLDQQRAKLELRIQELDALRAELELRLQELDALRAMLDQQLHAIKRSYGYRFLSFLGLVPK